MIEKAIKAEAKAGLQSASYIREIDHKALQGNRPAHVTTAKVQTQGIVMRIPESKNLNQRPRIPSPQIIPLAIRRLPRRLGKYLKRGFKKRSASKRTPALVPLLLGVIQPSTKQGLKA